MKKPSSRSQRGSKGIKGKHVLQICVLLGVCIWLIYQVKYSHDKKKEFYETDSKKSTVSLLSEREDGLVKLGRKDLLPDYHNQENENEKHVEEDEDEEEKESKSKVEEKEDEDEVAEEDEEDKNKQGEEVAEEDEEENKHEEDEIDEQDQSKTDGDTDKDDELVEEEKESGSNEKEKETNHADEIDMTVDEAREEHYKADDASSAVSHESRLLNTEKLKVSSGNSTGTAQENNSNATISEVEVQKEPILKLGEAESGDNVEKTTTEVKDGDSESSNSETKSAVTTESRGETVNGNSTEATVAASVFLQNETKIMRERSQEDGAPPSGSSGLQTVVELEQTRNESDLNITVSANITNKDSIQDVFSNSTSESSLIEENISGSNTTEVKEDSRSEGDDIQDVSSNSISESSLIENISGSNTTEVKENSRSEGDDETGEKESSNLFYTEQTEEADDTPESTMLQEEREALTDPLTLPDIRIEGNEEDEEEVITAE